MGLKIELVVFMKCKYLVLSTFIIFRLGYERAPRTKRLGCDFLQYKESEALDNGGEKMLMLCEDGGVHAILRF